MSKTAKWIIALIAGGIVLGVVLPFVWVTLFLYGAADFLSGFLK